MAKDTAIFAGSSIRQSCEEGTIFQAAISASVIDMDVIDAAWIKQRLGEERGAPARLGRHMGWDSAKVAKVLSGKRKVQVQEVPKVLDFFKEGGASAPVEDAENGTVLVPVFDVKASAGRGLIPLDYAPITHQITFTLDYIRYVLKADPKHVSIIRVGGDSMEPTLRDDDIVMFDASRSTFESEGIYVFRHGEMIHIKRVSRSGRTGFITVISDNKGLYPIQEFKADEVDVIGRAVWSGGKL